jgi:hypothetical protein
MKAIFHGEIFSTLTQSSAEQRVIPLQNADPSRAREDSKS